MMPGSRYMFKNGLWNELVFSDRFSGEVRMVVELLKKDPWKPGDALPRFFPLTLEPTAGLVSALLSSCLLLLSLLLM